MREFIDSQLLTVSATVLVALAGCDGGTSGPESGVDFQINGPDSLQVTVIASTTFTITGGNGTGTFSRSDDGGVNLLSADTADRVLPTRELPGTGFNELLDNKFMVRVTLPTDASATAEGRIPVTVTLFGKEVEGDLSEEDIQVVCRQLTEECR